MNQSTDEFIVLSRPLSRRLFQEHVSRYAFAKRLVSGKSVLDLACGTGYGSDFLGSAAMCVVGLDLSESALKFASRQYSRPNLMFARATATNLPLANEIVDICVSFETIEHLKAEDQAEYLREIARVLREGGYFVCSSPRAEVTKALMGNAGSWNPYHLSELSTEELLRLISGYFNILEILGQGTTRISSMVRIMLHRAMRKLFGVVVSDLIYSLLRRRIRPPTRSNQIIESELVHEHAPRRIEFTALSPDIVILVAQRKATRLEPEMILPNL